MSKALSHQPSAISTGQNEYSSWLKRNGYSHPASAPSGLLANRSFAYELCTHNGLALEHVHPDFRNDKEIVMAAITNNPDALQFASDRLCEDPEVLRAALLLSKVRSDLHPTHSTRDPE